MDLVLNNLQRLICHKTQSTFQLISFERKFNIFFQECILFQHHLTFLKLSGYVSVYKELSILILQPKFADENTSSTCIYFKVINTFFSLHSDPITQDLGALCSVKVSKLD